MINGVKRKRIARDSREGHPTGTITVSRTSYRDGKRSSEVHDSSTSIWPGEHAEYWKQTQKQLAMTSQKRKEPEGEQLQSLAITGPADTGDFIAALWGDSNEGGDNDGQDGDCAKGGAGKEGE